MLPTLNVQLAIAIACTIIYILDIPNEFGVKIFYVGLIGGSERVKDKVQRERELNSPTNDAPRMTLTYI